jgi:hypothetical protein
MFAAFLAALYPKLASIAFEMLITFAQKSGILNPVEAIAIRTEHDAVSAIQTLKTYPQYPTQKNDPFGGPTS